MPERWRACASSACRICSFLDSISMILTPVVIGHVAPAAPAVRGQTELAHGVNNAPGLGVNRAPALGVDYAPILSVDRASVPGVDCAPVQGVNRAPALGVDQAPSPGVDCAPDLGMHSSLLHHVHLSYLRHWARRPGCPRVAGTGRACAYAPLAVKFRQCI